MSSRPSKKSARSSSSQKARDQSTPWSDWKWDESRANHYQVRKNPDGEWEYYYYKPPAQSSSVNEIPRALSDSSAIDAKSSNVDTLSEDFASTSLTTTSSSSSSHYITSSSPITTYSSSAPFLPSSSSYTPSHATSGYAASSGSAYIPTNPASSNSESRSAYYPADSNSNDDAPTRSSFVPSGSESGGYGGSQPIAIPSAYYVSSRPQLPSMSQSSRYMDDDYDETSGYPPRSVPGMGQTSSYGSYSATPQARDNFFPASSSGDVGTSYDYRSGSSMTQPPTKQISGRGTITPVPKKDVHRHIKGTKGKAETLDPKFKIHHSRYFQPGEVFKVLWYEPKGGSNESVITEGPEPPPGRSDAMYGEVPFSKIRRFVIVAGDSGHCQCVPILTYQYQGTLKWGVKREEHAVIYTGDYPPSPIDGESDLSKVPIRVIPKTPRDKLNPASRVNYAKIYTVEHNVKVQFIGSIAAADRYKFNADFDETWANKRLMGSSYS